MSRCNYLLRRGFQSSPSDRCGHEATHRVVCVRPDGTVVDCLAHHCKQHAQKFMKQVPGSILEELPRLEGAMRSDVYGGKTTPNPRACIRCTQVARATGRQATPWTCEVCGGQVCEHFCCSKKPNGTATCSRCMKR